MKVLKFSSTLASTVDGIGRVSRIVEEAAKQGEVEVVVGSDYAAATMAVERHADVLEIWTDVDGFTTADPSVIPNAYTIERLTYNEAMELCNFGAKVFDPPSLYPACAKNIPIHIKNILHPERSGSIITESLPPQEGNTLPVRGISSITETSIVTVSGKIMVGVIGMNRRIFACLAAEGISVFMVVQTSSETSTSLCLTPADGAKACRVLDAEFAAEIDEGAMNPARLQEGMSTVAVVGENMKRTPGVAGRLFSVLGRNGISVSAIGQGASELNLSFVIERNLLGKALNVLHDSFFLSEYQEVNLFVCGVGTVGRSLLRQIAAQRDELMRERRLKVNLVGVCGTTHAAYDRNGLDTAHYADGTDGLANGSAEGGIGRMVKEVLDMNLYNSVFVDCTASSDVAAHYATLLSHNVNIVAANKVAASAPYADYQHLKETARERGVRYLFETNVGAGLPVISTIGDLRASGDKILRIEAVVSGTLNYIFSSLSAEVSLSQAVRQAQEAGYSEPDPRIDLSGRDVLRKLLILARESGYRVEAADVALTPFLPAELFEGDVEMFWKLLPTLDTSFEERRCQLAASHKCLRFIATWEDGHGHIGLREVDEDHPFYNLQGTNNIISLTTSRYRDPMLIQGYGAGADVTAAGVFADIMRCASY
ncbi:MAG: bifunctional aspartate kinase/homoserine dehydrogenase I [Alloprevotella sp.]|nr:bifunctional aspartate kinase/homoserine dehydrogenase I [Alloprevotella sp.]